MIHCVSVWSMSLCNNEVKYVTLKSIQKLGNLPVMHVIPYIGYNDECIDINFQSKYPIQINEFIDDEAEYFCVFIIEYSKNNL